METLTPTKPTNATELYPQLNPDIDGLQAPEKNELAVGEHEVNQHMTMATVASLDLLMGKKSEKNLETGVSNIQVSKHEIPQLTGESAQPGQRYELNYQRYGQQPENCVITVVGDAIEVTMHAEEAGRYGEANTAWASNEVGGYNDEHGTEKQFAWVYDRIDRLAQPVKEKALRTRGQKVLDLFVDKELRDIWFPSKK